ncbi:o-succinylbenzoate synthase [Maribacter hydrothermalis]|uniref:O-succinylbenzoate synthase n=1 Tax=Maribacter hydrothermalis TaxID=1836467 RepID=A0A1B7ZCQ4_9FLAO|nr:o-succinylbenzoate synthase [Maribacter hydrothermalis]APQ18546.1 o-succinylbenzoate synthase [Maribacter hydrothermalis]OBR40899.1 o-succinylbenzoate synthase [Maribacter hydrothermalis]
MKATFKKYLLNFKNPSGTSRGILRTKETWFLFLEEKGKWGVGECGLFRGLSFDDVPNYEEKCNWVVKNRSLGETKLLKQLQNFPSIQFGIEQALISLRSKNPFHLFDSDFLNNQQPITINGLVWMGDKEFMHQQIEDKLQHGFSCIKMKIGAIDFDTELALLKSIRERYSKEDIELRVDANGAFSPQEALYKLDILSKFDLHSIEQPIKQGQWKEMQKLCANTPLPIALDEELIGVVNVTNKEDLIQTIQPQYIILKPSLVGGFAGSNEWIEIAKKNNIGWWITSALESNIGLNAIAQWTATLNNKMPQGLGTGSMFTNNIDSPLEVTNGGLFYNKSKIWNTNLIEM